MTEQWQPLSVRRGKREPDGPYEGMPAHLRHAAGEWLRGQFGWFSSGGMRNTLMADVAMGLRIPVRNTHVAGGISNQIFAAIEQDDDLYLDCLDIALHLNRGSNSEGLARALQAGGSVWTVRDGRRGLERRVTEATADSYSAAIAAGDAVANELREAWSAVYGRHPNPSDAWDHAIKAIEDLLIPIVVPKVNKANLGTVAGEIRAHPDRWSFGVPPNGGRITVRRLKVSSATSGRILTGTAARTNENLRRPRPRRSSRSRS